MPKPLVIVESPAKARTISGFLGPDFVVESSVGNIRDLPRNAAEIPAKYKDQPWAALGVNVEEGFSPIYIVPKEKKAQVQKLKALVKDATELYLATDEDREGESIAWHLTQELKPSVDVKRMVFHEISRTAITQAVENTRDINLQLVRAQETRRILDRLYGYEVSPVLWKKVNPGLSAGRVQSVFTRLVVERERERMAFREASWWDLEATFARSDGTAGQDGTREFPGSLVSVDGSRLAAGRDFSSLGELANKDVLLLDEPRATALVEGLSGRPFSVRSVDEKPFKRSPHPPFMTSTLQQEAGRRLGFTTRRTMQTAQRLYENGYITYMRTDSTTLSEAAIEAARSLARDLYGPDYVPAKPRRWDKKSKVAQEAHEAIRPAGDTFRSPEEVARLVDGDEAKLYDLIWKRTVASEMDDARGMSVQVRIGTQASSGEDCVFASSGRTITFPGFLRAYVEGADDPEAELEDRQRFLPPLAEADALDALSMKASGHTTQPPARYTEPSLIRAVEELGVGRPSTYASMISTIQDRGYVWKKGSALIPSWTAFVVVTLLERHFGELVDYAFTARMEDVLDEIANGSEEFEPWLRRFYFGNGHPGLRDMVTTHLDQIDARQINTIPLGDAPDGEPVVVRVGRWGPYAQHKEDTAGLPEDLPPDELTVTVALEIIERTSKGGRYLGDDPETGLAVHVKAGRYGPYVQLGEGEGKEKPRTSSLFKSMSPESVTLEDALKLLTLPRIVGTHPETGATIEALNGRFGPYLKMGTDSRSLEREEQLFEVTLEEAVQVFAQPRRRRGAAAPLRELGEDPVSKKPVVLKEGRFGPYVTDGETNASLRSGDDPDTITLARAAELLQDRRERGPVTKKKRATTKKKAPAKKKPTSRKKKDG